MATTSKLMTVEEAASYLRMSVNRLAHLRISGDGPPFYKRTGRTSRVLYDQQELDSWLRESRQRSTVDTPGRRPRRKPPAPA